MSVRAPTADRMAPRADGSSWLWSLWGVVAIGLAYGLVYTSMRLAISHNLPQDDVTANILAQTLEPGYVVRQPPLLEWLLWSVQRLTGPTLLSSGNASRKLAVLAAVLVSVTGGAAQAPRSPSGHGAREPQMPRCHSL
jgi:hypothetical protein